MHQRSTDAAQVLAAVGLGDEVVHAGARAGGAFVGHGVGAEGDDRRARGGPGGARSRAAAAWRSGHPCRACCSPSAPGRSARCCTAASACAPSRATRTDCTHVLEHRFGVEHVDLVVLDQQHARRAGPEPLRRPARPRRSAWRRPRAAPAARAQCEGNSEPTPGVLSRRCCRPSAAPVRARSTTPARCRRTGARCCCRPARRV